MEDKMGKPNTFDPKLLYIDPYLLQIFHKMCANIYTLTIANSPKTM